MTKRSSFIILPLILFFLSPLLTAHVYAAVVINEIYPKPSDETGEWIELYNNGAESVSLNAWKLENTAGTPASFIINASNIIAGNSFMVFTRATTGINLDISGDTVNLYDGQGSRVDSQSYQSTLGYNKSVGRTADGAGVWAPCTTATYGKANDCPVPSPTPTPLPTPSPTPTFAPLPTLTPFATLMPTEEDAPIMYHPPVRAGVLGLAANPTPTPVQDDMIAINVPKTIKIPKMVLAQAGIITGAWIILAAIANYQKNRKQKRKKQAPPAPPAV